jgi:hypothetical protein
MEGTARPMCRPWRVISREAKVFLFKACAFVYERKALFQKAKAFEQRGKAFVLKVLAFFYEAKAFIQKACAFEHEGEALSKNERSSSSPTVELHHRSDPGQRGGRPGATRLVMCPACSPRP